jgi:hypothetical protein
MILDRDSAAVRVDREAGCADRLLRVVAVDDHPRHQLRMRLRLAVPPSVPNRATSASPARNAIGMRVWSGILRGRCRSGASSSTNAEPRLWS